MASESRQVYQTITEQLLKQLPTNGAMVVNIHTDENADPNIIPQIAILSLAAIAMIVALRGLNE